MHWCIPIYTIAKKYFNIIFLQFCEIYKFDQYNIKNAFVRLRQGGAVVSTNPRISFICNMHIHHVDPFILLDSYF